MTQVVLLQQVTRLILDVDRHGTSQVDDISMIITIHNTTAMLSRRFMPSAEDNQAFEEYLFLSMFSMRVFSATLRSSMPVSRSFWLTSRWLTDVSVVGRWLPVSTS